jgi:hypothetical protein
MRDDTNFYQAKSGETITQRMKNLCQGTKDKNFDQVTLETRDVTNNALWGQAYYRTVCDKNFRCSVINHITTSPWTELHEMSHTLGLDHDNLMPECDNDKGTSGFMGENESVFRDCYAPVLDKTFSNSRTYSCLFQSNTFGAEMGSWVGKK